MSQPHVRRRSIGIVTFALVLLSATSALAG